MGGPPMGGPPMGGPPMGGPPMGGPVMGGPPMGGPVMGGPDGILMPNPADTTLRVSSGSKAKSVAGKIAHVTRNGEAPSLMAIGASSVNNTVKAIAIARAYLKDEEVDLTCSPTFQKCLLNPDGTTGMALTGITGVTHDPNNEVECYTFKLKKSVLLRREFESTSEMKVAQSSEPGRVAGAIAGQIRAGGRVSLLSIGRGSAAHAVKAIAMARRYLMKGQKGDKKDTSLKGIDVSFRPEFISIPYDNDGERQLRSAIKFKLFVKKVA